MLILSKIFLFSSVFSPSISHARDGNLFEVAVIGGAQGLILGLAAIIYFMLWKPFKKKIDERNQLKVINKNNLTELMIASAEGDDEKVTLLLTQGCDVNEVGNSGETSLMFAAKNDKRSTLRILIANGANLDAKTKSGSTALDLAKKHGNSFVVDILNNAIDSKREV